MRRIRRIAVTPTVDLDAYTAGDVVGGLLTFAITDQGFDGLIRAVAVVDDADQKEAYTLNIFESQPSTIADDAAYAPTVADLKKLITTVTVAAGDYATENGNARALLGSHEDTAMKQAVHSNNGDIYLYAVATDTPDYAAATDLTIIVTVEVF